MQVTSEEETKQIVGQNVAKFRGSRSLSQLARDCTELTHGEWTCYAATIQQIEDGKYKTNVWHLAIIAETLGCTLNDILPMKVSRHRRTRLANAG
jgi:hypothetical protein